MSTLLLSVDHSAAEVVLYTEGGGGSEPLCGHHYKYGRVCGLSLSW